MRTLKPISGRLGRIGLAFAALVSVAAMAGPAAADNWNHRHYGHHNNGFFSFGFSSPGYYYAPPPAYYYYPPPPPRYYYYAPPPAYYYPPPAYYGPSASFDFVIPFGGHHH
jgi:hypothetical protein